MNYPNDKTVLVVNDTPDQLELMQFIFEHAGYNVSTASNGTEGFQFAKNNHLDLVISDVIMPEGDGIELCRWIRADEKLRSLPILLVSGMRKDVSNVIEGLEVGADDYIELPAEPLHLIARAARLIERKKMEDKLRESADYFRSLIENISDIITILSVDGTILYESPSVEHTLGYQPEELIGKQAFDFVHPDDLEKVNSHFLASTENLNTGVTVEFRFKHRTDSWRILESIGRVINDPSREEVVIITSRDITERKRADQSLRESEENFRALVLATTQFVWTIKENIISEDFSQWWMELTGQTFEEVQGLGWLVSVHPEDREIVGTVWQNAFTDRILFDTSYRVRTKTGEYRHYAVRGVPVFNADGSFRQWIGTFNDITEHKQAEEALLKSEEQLRQSQKLEAVGRLAGGIAHDFNNMLTAINGYSELTLRKLEADNPLRRNIEEIKKAGERSALLTHQLLAFSRQQVLQSQILDLNDVITDTSKMLELLIGEDIRFETILDTKLGHIIGDSGQLTQVIMNLAVNARDSMPKGGSLIIETANVFLDEEFAVRHIPTKPGQYVMLAVTDTGSGMDEETQQNIFEPFYTTKDVGKGTGLGLATVYGIVKQSGGFIWLDTQLEVGSTFKIYLPCINAEVQSRKETVEPTAKGSATILIVDDEDLVRTLTRQTLEECGYKVIEANSGSIALAICLQQNCAIDLVITDIVMPQMSGRELAEKLAEDCPGIPVLFTSGYTDDEITRHDVIKMDTNFIQKPFTFDVFARKVKEVLEN